MPSLYSLIRGMLFEALAEENPQRTVGDTCKVVDRWMHDYQIRHYIEQLKEKEDA